MLSSTYAMPKVSGMSDVWPRDLVPDLCLPEITEEIIVYRYSQERTLDYLRRKVARLSEPSTLEISRTVVRGLAKDGLMEDGNEELLKSE